MQIWILAIQLSPLLLLSTQDFTPTELLMFLALYPQSNVCKPRPMLCYLKQTTLLQIFVC